MAAMAEEFHVSVRTIQRDIVVLSGEMQIPIYCQYGKYDGGVYIDSGYNMDRMYMTEKELVLLNKIKDCNDNEGKLSLTQAERELLCSIIQNYKKPCLN